MAKKLNVLFVFLLCVTVMIALAQNKRPGKDHALELPVTGPAAAGRVVVAQEYDVRELDPRAVADTGSARVISNVYEGLVRFKPGTAMVEPCLASSWKVSGDGMTWTFNLRRDVRFHDGTPFDARAVQFNFERQLNRQPGGVTTYADFVFAPLDRVEVVDSHTVKLHLKYPCAPFLNNLAMPLAAPLVSPKAIQKYGDNLGLHPAGTGPFMPAGKTGNGILLKANHNYWQPAPAAREILFITVPGAEQRTEQLLQGQIDIALDLTFIHTARLRLEGYPVFRATGLDICYLGFYTDQKPFNRPSVRRAVALALNREKIFNELWPHEVRPALGPLPPTVPGYNPDLTRESYDPDGAARLLREAGFGDGLSFTLVTYNDSRPYSPGGGKKLADALARSLAEAGINMKIKSYPWREFKQALDRREGDAFLYGWISDNGDPDNFLFTLLAQSQIKSGMNITRYHNDQLDTLLLSARNTTDPEIRRELYIRAQEIIHRDTPWVVLSHSVHHAATARNIQGFVLSPTGWHSLYGITKD
jgi:peptide/nickel transport system substrate-binding protein